MSEGPLSGRTIVVTRAREQASELSERLRAYGAEVIEIPTIAIVPPRSYEQLDLALRNLQVYDWLIVTSANTARVLRQRLNGRALDFQPRTVAVGRATAAALQGAGLRVDLTPEPAIAESIVGAIRNQVAGKRVLLARAEVARDLLPVALGEAGALVTVVDAYRTVLAVDSAGLVSAIFGGLTPEGERSEQMPQKIDALTFTSSSTVKNLAALIELAGAAWPTQAKIFAIGPITSGSLRELGLEPDFEARQHDVAGLVEAVLQGLAQTQRAASPGDLTAVKLSP